MSIQGQARALMSRHHQLIKNREQSMLFRAVADIGLDVDVTHYHSHIQGKTPANFGKVYDRNHAAMS
ncbi:MAG: hypothetical protein AB4426_00690 [Xenococcaceae cyanobacterium]